MKTVTGLGLAVVVLGAFAVACSAEAPSEPTASSEQKLDGLATGDTSADPYAAEPGGYPALCNDSYDRGRDMGLTQCTINGKKFCEVTCRTGENVRTCCRRLGFGYLDAIAGKTCSDFPAPTSNETAAVQ